MANRRGGSGGAPGPTRASCVIDRGRRFVSLRERRPLCATRFVSLPPDRPRPCGCRYMTENSACNLSGWSGNKGHEVGFRSDGRTAGSRGFHAHRPRWLRRSRDLGRYVTRVAEAARAGGKDLACLRERRSTGGRSTPATHGPASRERGSPIQEASTGAKPAVSIGRWRTMPARLEGTTDSRGL
jgi:hypothetical protein